MKKLLLYTSILLGTASCSKYLEETPDNRTEITTVDQVAGLLVSAYPDRHYLFTESASDNSEDKTTKVSSEAQPYTDLYFWRDPEGTGNSTPAEYWIAAYEAIASANYALKPSKKITSASKRKPLKAKRWLPALIAIICW